MKVLTRDHSTMTLMAWYAILGFLLAIPPAFYVWRWPSAPDLALLDAMGVLGVITQARLVFAVILGYALFNDIPNTIYITLREARLGNSKPPPERVE